VNLQVVAALGFIGTPDAVALLVGKLEQFGAHAADPDAKEVCSKIVSTLFGVGTERAVDAAGTFCVARNLVSVHRDDFARAVLPPSLRERIAARIRSETRTLRITKSLIGNASGAKALLSAVGHSGYPEIDAVCHEMTAAFPARHQLAAESARILATPAPPPLIASDRLLHAHLAKGDLPQALCHAYDAGSCGRIEVTTREGVECWIDVALGQVVSAGVSDSLVENERALHWIALLEGKDVRTIAFRPAERPADAASVATPTSELLRDLLFQRAEVRHIVDGIISPESRFQRRDVHPIYTDFSRLDQPDRYAMVWRLLAEEVDMRGLRSASGLSRHDIFRILLYFHRRNMISVDGARRDAGVARVSDAIATMEVYLQRIERRPLQLRFYHMAAEACAFLERQVVTDDALSTAASALGTYLLEAYNAHRAFSEENLDICKRTLTLIAQYHRGRNAGDRQDLVDYVGFTFAAVSAPARPMGEESRSLLEQLENIAYTNDPFDLSDHERDSRGVDILVETVRAALAAAGVTVEALAEGEQPTSSEARIIVELFGAVATAYTKPIKDFVREITRARATSEPVASAWLRVVEPSVNLLAGISAAMHFRKLDAIVGGLARAFADEKSRGEREIAPAFGEYVLARHDRLAELCPLAFGLYLSDEQLAVKRSELLATFVLRQLEGVTDEVVDRLAAANMTTVESYLDMVPEDIVVAAGIDAKLGDTIFMKFYQYRDLFEFDGDPAANPKYAAMFEIGLTTLKEICVELEKIGRAEQAGRETDAAGKERLLASRQRALASLLALLCMRGQYDRIEQIQVAPFEKRVLLLDQYFAELAGDAAPSGPNPSRMAPRADAAA
jgi:hypothetical protein